MIAPAMSHDSLVRRELDLMERFFELMSKGKKRYCDRRSVSLSSIKKPTEKVIARACKKTQKIRPLTLYDRFIPSGLSIEHLFAFFHGWHKTHAEDERFKFSDVVTDYFDLDQPDYPLEYENIPTEAGIYWQDLWQIMVPVDINGTPFCFDYKEQKVWAKECGGDDIFSAEAALYSRARCLLEIGYLPYYEGSERCRNNYQKFPDGAKTICLRFDPHEGLRLDCERRKRCGLFAAPWIFIKA